MTITRKLAEFASSLSFDEVPDEVVQRSRILLLDTLGIIIRGGEVDSTVSMKKAMKELGLTEGGIHVPGLVEGYSPYGAALLAGAAAHSLDFDDTHAPAQIHPGAPVIAAALAAAQVAEVDLKALLTGIVAGYEVMARVSYGLEPLSHSDRGFHLTATTGVFGAVAAAGNIYKLDPEMLEHAFGTALSQTAGSGQFLVNGAWTKRFHVGHAAASGIMATTLAKHGYTGASQAFEGDAGFFKLYSPSPTPEKAVVGLKESWELLGVAIKPYPCCRAIHAPIDAILELREKFEINPAAIECVEVGMPRKCFDITGYPQERKRQPKNVVDCQFSLHLCVAYCLAYGGLKWGDFDKALGDQEVFGLMSKINAYVDEDAEKEYPISFPGRVKVTLKDGTFLESYVKVPKGEPSTMLSDVEMMDKFESLVANTVSGADLKGFYSAINSQEVSVVKMISHLVPKQ